MDISAIRKDTAAISICCANTKDVAGGLQHTCRQQKLEGKSQTPFKFLPQPALAFGASRRNVRRPFSMDPTWVVCIQRGRKAFEVFSV